MILIIVTPYMIPTSVFMEANYIPIFIEIDHSKLKLLSRNHFSIIRSGDLDLDPNDPIRKC